MKTTGLTKAVMGQLTTTPRKQEEIIGALPKAFQKLAAQILYQKHKAGVIERTGSPRNYVFTLKAPAQSQPATGMSPENPASGRCIDALNTLLRRRPEPMTRSEIIEHMPKGYSPHQIVEAMSDAVHAGWLTSRRTFDRVEFSRNNDVEPEASAPDPLVAAFAAITPRQRVDQIHLDLKVLLGQMLGDHASPTVLHHLAAANHHLHQLHPYL